MGIALSLSPGGESPRGSLSFAGAAQQHLRALLPPAPIYCPAQFERRGEFRGVRQHQQATMRASVGAQRPIEGGQKINPRKLSPEAAHLAYRAVCISLPGVACWEAFTGATRFSSPFVAGTVFWHFAPIPTPY